MVFHVHCSRCGEYKIHKTTTLILRGKDFSALQRANASGFLRQNQQVLLEDRDVNFLAELRTPSLAEKAHKLLLRMVDEHPSPGDGFMINIWALQSLQPVIDGETRDEYPPDLNFTEQCQSVLPWLATAWAMDFAEMEFLLFDYLTQTKGLVRAWKVNGYVTISSGGWDYLDTLRRQGGPAAGTAFVAMWFDPSVHDAWLQAIEPAIRSAGYEPVRIDKVEHNNRIDDEIVAAIRACRFLVSDFTGHRGGVYFEAGFAQGLGKQVIWLCRSDELTKVHFDTRQYNFITWDQGALGDLKERLKLRIEATLGKGGFRG